MAADDSELCTSIHYKPDVRPSILLAFGFGLQPAIFFVAGIVLTAAIVVHAGGGTEAFLSWAVFTLVGISGMSTVLQAIRLSRIGRTLVNTSGAGSLRNRSRLCEKPPGRPPCLLEVEWGMAHITGTDRAQVLLLPDTVDDYVGPDNPVRFIDAFVDSLDLAGAGFERAEPKETGRPGYDPSDLPKLYIYGYLNRVRSSRRLEAETHRNLEAIRQVFRDFVKVCRSLELFGRELIAVDGTRIKAVNSRDRNFTGAKLRRDLAASQERLERYLQQMDEMDAADMADASPSKGRGRDLAQKITALRERQARLETHRKALRESGEDPLSLTDPDARAMHSGTGVGVGYNVQIAVDTKHKLIAEQQAHSQVSDLGLLAETGRAARTSLGVERIDAVADKGYFKVEDIAGCEAAGITPYVPKPRRSPARRSGRFPKERFRYDAGTDTYACPNGQQLKPLYISRVRDTTLMHDANRGACRGCALKAQCTSNSYRRIGRYADEAVLDRMAERLADRPGVLHRRRESAEHPFGSIKHWMGHGGFLMRRLKNVRGEFSLTALAYNIRRATTLVGIPGTDRRGPSVIAGWGVQTSWNRPPKGLFQRIRAHGISESTTIHSRPKSQASHTAKFDSGLLFTQSRTVVQPSNHFFSGD